MSVESEIVLDKIRQLEEVMLQLPQVDFQTSHLIHGGMYARTIFIPAGTAIVGALTKLDNIVIFNGDITVTTDDGSRRFAGFHVLPANKGRKRVGIAHADTYWTTLIKTDAKTNEDAEEEMTDEASRLQTRRTSIQFDWHSHARADYNEFIREFGLTLQFIDSRMRSFDDVIETPSCLDNIEISKSFIHGVGVFAKRDIVDGESIAPARRDMRRCLAGRFTNHSHDPNAMFVRVGVCDHVDMVATRNIGAGEEITIDYRQSGRLAYEMDLEV
jgi:hypothetical protein